MDLKWPCLNLIQWNKSPKLSGRKYINIRLRQIIYNLIQPRNESAVSISKFEQKWLWNQDVEPNVNKFVQKTNKFCINSSGFCIIFHYWPRFNLNANRLNWTLWSKPQNKNWLKDHIGIHILEIWLNRHNTIDKKHVRIFWFTVFGGLILKMKILDINQPICNTNGLLFDQIRFIKNVTILI